MTFFSLIMSRELLLCARAPTTSIWNFTIQWTSHDDLTEKSADIFHFKHQKKPREMTEIQNCTLQFDEKTVEFRICTKVRSS